MLRALLVVLLSLWVTGCGGEQDSSHLLGARAPEPVEDLKATAGDGRIRLNWQALENDDLIAYKVYRSEEEDAGYQLVGSVGNSQRPYYEDLGDDDDGDGTPDGLTNGMTYHYKVVGVDKDGFDGLLSLASRTEAQPALQPGSFRDLQLSDLRVYAGQEHILLTFQPIRNEEVWGYRVYREVLQETVEPVLLGTVPPGRQHFTDTTVQPDEDYRYVVAPVNRNAEEGRRLSSRVVRLQDPLVVVPLAPGHDRAAGALVRVGNGSEGIQIRWSRPLQTSDGRFFQTESEADTMLGGGYIVYRASGPRGSFAPIAILEESGGEALVDYTDPGGTSENVYMVRAFDRYGTLGFESRYLSGGSMTMPDLVRNLDAFASTSSGQVLLEWDPEPQALSGYRVFRSRLPDRGYEALGDVAPQVVSFVDGVDIALDATWYYRVAPLTLSPDLRIFRGALSSPASATPGPSSDRFLLEAEDARVLLGSTSGLGSIQRRGLPRPWTGSGALEVPFDSAAVPGSTAFALRWDVELATDGSNPIRPRAYDVYLKVLRDDQAPEVNLEVEAVGSQLGGGLASQGRTNVVLFQDQFGDPEIPTMVPVGNLAFEDFNRGGLTQVRETLDLVVTLQALDPATSGTGRLLIDGLVLLRR